MGSPQGGESGDAGERRLLLLVKPFSSWNKLNSQGVKPSAVGFEWDGAKVAQDGGG
jgi:hypothetical protein